MRRFYTGRSQDAGHRNGNGRPDLIGLVGFHDRAFVVAKPAEPYAAWLYERSQTLREKLGTRTNMTAGVNLAVSLIRRSPHGVYRRIWLLSDGHPNVDTGGLGAALQQAQRARCNVNTIGFGDDYDERLLKQIAGATHNGKFVPVKTLQQLTDTLIATNGQRTNRHRHHHRSETTVLAIDLSASMGGPMGGRTKVEVVEEAVKRLLAYKQALFA
jgi:hypothetical protein